MVGVRRRGFGGDLVFLGDLADFLAVLSKRLGAFVNGATIVAPSAAMPAPTITMLFPAVCSPLLTA